MVSARRAELVGVVQPGECGSALWGGQARFLKRQDSFPVSMISQWWVRRSSSELKRLHQQLKITTIYVTHDQVEALTLSDRIAVMGSGELQQVGTASEIYRNPSNIFVAEFIGSPGINLIAIEPTDLMAAQRLQAAFGDRIFQAATLGIRPEDIEVVAEGAGDFDCTVEFTEPYGAISYAFLSCDGIRMRRAGGQLVVGLRPHDPCKVGTRVGIRLPPSRTMLFSSDGGALA